MADPALANAPLPGLRHVEHVMGTVVSFDIRDRPDHRVRQALSEAVAWLHHVDAVFSTYRADSQISRLGRGEIAVADCVSQVAEVLALCEAAERATEGWFSSTAGGRLDPSGLVKGWAVERASDILHDAGVRNTCVDGGGDVQLRGMAAPGMPWRIGVAHPTRRGELAAVVTGFDLAVATAGPAERGPHILDPHTGRPATGFASITLTGPRLTTVDAYATAAFAMGQAARHWIPGLPGTAALAITPDGESWQTADFPGLPPN
jgi:FAD:protein FMN transferase